MQPKDLAGKSALVTGASRGIGAASAIALARHGISRVAIHYGGFREGAEHTAAAVRDAGATADIVEADLGSDAGIAGFAAWARGEGPFDILVNNAGSLVERARLDQFTPELYDRVMNLNVKAVYFVAQAVAPAMIERGSGIIINLSSIAARNGGGLGATIYAASKAAVACMTKGMARELAPKGIRVNAVSPGTVVNHFHEVFSTSQMLESMKAQTPAGKLGTNEEVADTILFLCSDAARYIHGQTIEVNGGMYMV
jgi:3-oxoacyl-[acyl-carrier protein] reductase